MGEPPLLAGAQVIVAESPSLVPEMLIGADGTVTGVTGADAVEAGEDPTALIARTTNVYGVPLSRPTMVQVSLDAFGSFTRTVQVRAGNSTAVTVYDRIGEPLGELVFQRTSAVVDEAVASTAVGAP